MSLNDEPVMLPKARGVPVGTGYNWYILADQVVRRSGKGTRNFLSIILD
jgi:hypothetical protein